MYMRLIKNNIKIYLPYYILFIVITTIYIYYSKKHHKELDNYKNSLAYYNLKLYELGIKRDTPEIKYLISKVTLPKNLKKNIFKIIENMNVTQQAFFQTYKTSSHYYISDYFINFYENDNFIKQLIYDNFNEKVYNLPRTDKQRMIVQHYDSKIKSKLNWHQDFNRYNGNYYTFLVRIDNNDTDMKLILEDPITKKLIEVDNTEDKSIVIDSRIFHKGTPITKGKRYSLSVAYSTIPLCDSKIKTNCNKNNILNKTASTVFFK